MDLLGLQRSGAKASADDLSNARAYLHTVVDRHCRPPNAPENVPEIIDERIPAILADVLPGIFRQAMQLELRRELRPLKVMSIKVRLHTTSHYDFFLRIGFRLK